MLLTNWFLEKIVNWCDKNNRHRTIMSRDGKSVYLERYYLLFRNRVKFPINLVIHEFKKSDEDDLHDHPWSFFTFIIKGEYDETTLEGTYRRKPFQFRYHDSNTFHRVKLINEQPVWTFFVMGPKCRGKWGFLHGGQWIESEEYLKTKEYLNKRI